MNEDISRLMDGEVDDDATDRILGAMKGSGAVATWACYHAIGDALRGECSFAPRVSRRIAVALALPESRGPALHFYLGKDTPRWLHNLEWLGDPLHLLWLPTYFAFLPLLWLLLGPQIARPHRGLGLVALAYFTGLMLVANIYEPRVYGELMVLLYVPAGVALCRWLRRADRLEAP